MERARALEESGEPKCVAAPAAAELLTGAYHFGGSHLVRAKELIDSLILLEMDLEASDEAGRIGADLLSRGEALGTADLFIAAISKRHGQRVLTRDRAYAKVRGLTFETY